MGDKGEVVVDFCQGVAQGLVHIGRGRTGSNGLQAADFGIALEHFKTHPHLVDAVINGFEFGRLVDHVFRRGDLAAIMQPGRDMHGFPFFRVELEVLIRSARFGAGGPCQHLGEFRHAGAVTAGVRTFGVNRAGNQLDEGGKKLLLSLD
jgi:hypothetical protein